MKTVLDIHTVEEQTQEIVRSILNRLKNQHLFPCEEYSSRTIVLNHPIHAPHDAQDALPEEEIQKAADALLLQIREGGFDTFVRLPEPRATEITCTAVDRATGLAVRFVRCFDPIQGVMLAVFSIGVHARN